MWREICAWRELEPARHLLFEEMILILSGRGSTTIWNNAGARVTFEWKAGRIFAVSLNCWYQHFTGSRPEEKRFVAVTKSVPCDQISTTTSISSSTRPTTSRTASPANPDYFSAKGAEAGRVPACRPTLVAADAINLAG